MSVIKLEVGYYGSNMQTLGAYNYRGFDVIVDDANMGMPKVGGPYMIGIYNAGEYEAVETTGEMPNFNEETVLAEIDKMISDL